jgi:deferrochelatase/peroxidase EfeB
LFLYVRLDDRQQVFAHILYQKGALLALAPLKDNEALGQNMNENNNFDYRVDGKFSDIKCPFTAHTRKIVPRDLDPFINKDFLKSSMIMRAGIPYGPEVRLLDNVIMQDSDHPDSMYSKGLRAGAN